MKPVPVLSAGEVGYVATGLKTVHDARVGDTITSTARPAARAAAWLPHPQADGLCRDLSGGSRRLPGPA